MEFPRYETFLNGNGNATILGIELNQIF